MSGYIGDGVPDSGRYNLAPDGSVQTGPGDNSMTVIFYKRAVHNAVKSGNAGRPVHEDVDFVRIHPPGERLNIVEREVQQNDKRRWPNQWNAYASGKEQSADGTPLGLLFPRHPAVIANLQAMGFNTVEHLANASATAIDAIGMNGQDYVNYAQKYLQTSTGGVAFHKMQMEVEDAKRREVRLMKQLEDMQTQIAQMNATIMAQAGAVALQHQPIQRMQPVDTKTDLPKPPSFGNSQAGWGTFNQDTKEQTA